MIIGVLVAAEANALAALYRRENLDGARRNVIVSALIFGLAGIFMNVALERLPKLTPAVRGIVVASGGVSLAALVVIFATGTDPFLAAAYAALFLVFLMPALYHFERARYWKAREREADDDDDERD